MNLSSNTFNIAHILYFLLFKYFDSDFLTRKIVISKLDFPKRALSDSLAYKK
jgi:hypothetical protein